jgi:5-methylcytosine-specific restriction endonuclease McrA
MEHGARATVRYRIPESDGLNDPNDLKALTEQTDEMTEPFIIEVTEEDLKREKARARELRKSRWWQQRLARGMCTYCGRRFPPEELTMDHIVPLIRGGKSTRGNVCVVCRECNSKKKYLLPMEWEEYLQHVTREEEIER